MRTALRQCERAVTVEAGLTSCGSCVRGQCPTALACHIPESDAPKPRARSLSRRARNRLLMAAIAGGGVLVCGVAELFHRLT